MAVTPQIQTPKHGYYKTWGLTSQKVTTNPQHKTMHTEGAGTKAWDVIWLSSCLPSRFTNFSEHSFSFAMVSPINENSIILNTQQNYFAICSHKNSGHSMPQALSTWTPLLQNLYYAHLRKGRLETRLTSPSHFFLRIPGCQKLAANNFSCLKKVVLDEKRICVLWNVSSAWARVMSVFFNAVSFVHNLLHGLQLSFSTYLSSK